MEPELWHRVEDLYHRALELDESRRAGFLKHSCADDEVLRREVESLLAQEKAAEHFIESPALEVMGKLIAREPGTTKGETELTGTTVSHYHVMDKLGAGGMGVVYRARDERLDRDVALKVLPPGSLSDQASRTRFRKEALALSRIAHPNIAVVHDFDTFGDTDFLVMELVPGMTLDQKLMAGKLAEAEAVAIGIQLLDGLSAAHKQDVIHCDIKPSNLRLTPDGHVKILDFGLARVIRHGDALAATMSISQDYGVAGSLPYMAPEQLQEKLPDARTDVYAAGCVLYEMATGRRVVPVTNAPMMIDCILNRSPENPSTISSGISSGLEYIILKSLERDPAARYQSASEMAVDLRRSSTLSLSSPPAVSSHPPIRQSIWRIVAYLALVAVVASSIAYLLLRRPPMDSIAILPLKNLTGNSELDYLSDGVADSLINSISQLPNLKVVSGTSVIRYKGREADPQTLGRDLHVQAVLTGKYSKRDNNLIISVELSDARDNRHIWGEQYNRSLEDVAAVQEDVSRQIADMLRLKLTDAERQQIVKKYTDNPEAYQLYLKGRHYQFKDTPDDLRKSRQYYEQAIDADPNYALAYAGLAGYYGYMAWSGELSPQEAFPKQEAAALRAIQLDPSLGVVYCELAFEDLLFKWDWPGAENQAKQCSTLAPNDPESLSFSTIYLRTMHRFDEALHQAQHAAELDPFTPERKSNIGLLHYFARQYDAAAQQYLELTHSDPDLPGPHARLFDIYSRTGKEFEAIAELEKALALQGADELAAALPKKYKSSGFEGAKDFALQEQTRILTEASKQEYISPTALAANYALLNQKEQAFAWLEKAFAEHTPGLIDLDLDPDYDNLRNDSRFQDLIQRIGLRRPATPSTQGQPRP